MNKRYLKKSNESEYEYGLRLIEIKVEEKPEDLEWSDIVDLLGLNVHKDSLHNTLTRLINVWIPSKKILKPFKPPQNQQLIYITG